MATSRARKVGGRAKKATISRPPPSLIIPDEEEVVKVVPCAPDDSVWIERLDREPPENLFCEGCPLGSSCIITRIAAVMFCHKKCLDNS